MIPVMIVPVLRFYKKLQMMLDSVDYPVGHVIIFDNGGALDSAECSYAEKLSIVRFPSNLGVPTIWNLGIKLEPYAKYWLFTQDDIVWNSGGLQKIDNLSNSDSLCLAVSDDRPFSSFTVGEDVIEKVGLFDESFFPLVGDDFNFHKRCHFFSVTEKDISGTFRAEKSATIKDMANTKEMSFETFQDNLNRSIWGPPTISRWSLSRRRKQGSVKTTDLNVSKFKVALDSNYKIHNSLEMQGFASNLEVSLCEACGSSLRQEISSESDNSPAID